MDTIKPYPITTPEREHIPTRAYGSVPDLKMLDLSASEKAVSPSDSISLKETRMSDEEVMSLKTTLIGEKA